MADELPERVRRAEERREFRELLNRSSLGPIPDSRPVCLGEGLRSLTGMPEEQRDWEEY